MSLAKTYRDSARIIAVDFQGTMKSGPIALTIGGEVIENNAGSTQIRAITFYDNTAGTGTAWLTSPVTFEIYSSLEDAVSQTKPKILNFSDCLTYTPVILPDVTVLVNSAITIALPAQCFDFVTYFRICSTGANQTGADICELICKPIYQIDAS